MKDPSPLEAIFFAALEKGSPQERAAYLHDACADDPDLHRRIEKMLAAQAHAGSFLEQPARSPLVTIDDEPLRERPGMVIGSYKLLEQIGEGGFGVVFMAVQTQPVRRKVALKILKPGMDTRQASLGLKRNGRRWRSWITRTLPRCTTVVSRHPVGPTSSWNL